MKIVPVFVFKNAFHKEENSVDKIGFMNIDWEKKPFYG